MGGANHNPSDAKKKKQNQGIGHKQIHKNHIHQRIQGSHSFKQIQKVDKCQKHWKNVCLQIRHQKNHQAEGGRLQQEKTWKKIKIGTIDVSNTLRKYL